MVIKQPYRISIDLKDEKLYNAWIDLVEKYYDGNVSKAGRKAIKKVIEYVKRSY